MACNLLRLLIFVGFCAQSIGIAQAVVPLKSSTSAPVKLSHVESYLNKLKTLQASFKQWDQNGALTTGTLYLQRPGHIRMTYNKPSKLVILADGETLFFIDRATKDLSYSPIGQSPASFLLDAHIDFQKGFKIKSFHVDGNKIKLTIRKKGNDDLGALTLVFRKSPSLQLIQWIILDSQNKKTIVNLEGVTSGHDLTPTLFDPSVFLGQ